MRKTILFILLMMAAMHIVAIPAYNGSITRMLPNGQEVEVWLHGDETYSYYTDKEGNRVRFDEEGWMVPDTTQAANTTRRTTTYTEHTYAIQTEWKGNARGIVILVAYADVAFSINEPQEAFRAMLNDQGYSKNGATGSARDYFEASSMGRFTPTFDIYGPYTLSHNRAYYGAGSNGNDSRARDMVKEACQLAAKDGVDFTQYDNDNDGYVDNIFIYYAGYNEAEGGPTECIWPHRSVIYNGGTYSGKQIYDYACTSELRSNKGIEMAGIGTFCHEFSHVLGLRDHYNTSNSHSYTTGTWDIMSSGSYNNSGRTPPTYTAFERFMVGWLEPIQISTPGSYTLRPIETHNEAYLLAATQHNLSNSAPNPSEFFLLENRQELGWDSVNIAKGQRAQPGHGLLITHITYNNNTYWGNSFNNSTPMGYDIVEAYNPNPTESTAADTYPGTGGVTTFLPVNNKGTAWSTMQLQAITEWTEEDHSIRFLLGERDTTKRGLYIHPDTIPMIETEIEKGKIVRYHTPYIRISGQGLEGDSVYISSTLNNIYLSLDTLEWKLGTIALAINKYGRVDKGIWLRFKSSKQGCIEYTGSLMAYTQDKQYYDARQLIARSPKAIHTTTPTTIRAQALSGTSVHVVWEPVAFAEYYQLQVYTLDEKQIPHYLYRYEDLELQGINEYTLTNLSSDCTYYIQIRAGESNDCDIQYTVPSAPIAVTPSSSASVEEDQLEVRTHYEGHSLVVITPLIAEPAMLYVYTPTGQCVASIEVGAYTPYVALDAYLPHLNGIYLCKYAGQKKYSRKSPWLKIKL